MSQYLPTVLGVTSNKMNGTIAQATSNYKAKSATPDGCLNAMIAAVLAQDLPLELKNDCYEDALEFTEKMLQHTQQNINILTGGACGGFYATLLEHLTATLGRIRATGGSARMIVLAPQYPEWLEVLAQEFSGTFTLARFTPVSAMQHFIVCDSKIVRLENIHEELRPDSPSDAIKAQVIFNEPAKGLELEKRFQALWEKSEINRVDPARKTTAPSWLIQRMDALRHQRPPTSEEVDTQLTASAALRRTLSAKALV